MRPSSVTLAALALTLTGSTAFAEQPDDQATLDKWNVPPDLQARGDKAGIFADHPIDYSINPFYLRGDFDGDRRPDYMVSVKGANDTEPKLIVLRGKGKPIWIDRDVVEYPARDIWYVVDRKEKIEEGAAGGTPPRLKGDAIMIEKAESSSALIYWNGKKFASYWQGD